MDKVLIFDLFGYYGHFRKYYTTTSPLSFSIPPRTALTGLIGAIIGLSKESYSEILSRDNANISVGVVNPIKKVRFSENLIDTGDDRKFMRWCKNHTQIRFEFLKNPCYRIFFWHKDPKIYNTALEYLQSHQCVFTPCLGISEHLADFRFIGEVPVVCREGKSMNLVSAIREDLISNLSFEEGKEYLSENLPNEMTSDRIVKDYSPFIFERNGQKVQAVVSRFWEMPDGNSITIM
jgi:CRISPR-associated protein Cas5h